MKIKHILSMFCIILLVLSLSSVSVYAGAGDECDSFSDINHAEVMAQKLAKKNIKVELTEVTPKEFTTGNVVVYMSQGKYVRYLKVADSVHEYDPLIFEGHNGKEIKIWTYGYSTQPFIKLTSKLINGSKFVDGYTLTKEIAEIQKEELDAKLKVSENLRQNSRVYEERAFGWQWYIPGMYYYWMYQAEHARDKADKIDSIVLPDLEDWNYYHNKSVSVPKVEDMRLTTNVNHELNGIFNANDPNNGKLEAQLEYAPLHGKVSINGNKFTYTPLEGYAGVDVFKYSVHDQRGRYSDVASVNVDVIGESVSVGPGTLNIAENNTITAFPGPPVSFYFPVWSYPREDRKNNLTVVLETMPRYGTLTIGPGALYSYVPFKGYIGEDKFSYRVKTRSGELSNIGWVFIDVKPFPFLKR